MHRYIAVIDCGTNTFTLNIYDAQSDNPFIRTAKERYFVELAEEGIATIGAKAFERGIAAFQSFKKTLATYENIHVVALGTAALRSASNATEFVEAVVQNTGIPIQIIGGKREALLIHKGVRLAAPLSDSPSLIMDIGGGSVEFIIANQTQLFWAKSYPIGGSVLFNELDPSDPILDSEIQQLETQLQQILEDLLAELQQHTIQYLIGASGSFDVIDNLTQRKNATANFSTINVQDFQRLYKQLVPSSFEQRLQIENLMPTRAKLIVMSMLLINFTLQHIHSSQLIASDYAMREGLVHEWLNSDT